MGKVLKGLATWVVALIVIIVVVVAAVGIYYGIALTHHPTVTTTSTVTTTTTSTTSTTTTTSVTPTTSTTVTTTTSTTTVTTPTTTTNVTTFLNTSNPQVLMQIVGLTSPPSTPVTLTVWDTYSLSEDQGFNQTLAVFEQDFPWIHLVIERGAPVGTSQFAMACKSYKAPILYRDYSLATISLAYSGYLLNLSQVLPPNVLNEVLSEIFPAANEGFEYKGGVWAITDDISPFYLLYNKHFVPYPPNSTGQLMQIAEQVNETYHIYGMSFAFFWWGATQPWLLNYSGGKVDFMKTVDGITVPVYNSTSYIDYLEFWYKMFNVLHVAYFSPSGQATGIDGQLFISNRTAMIVDGPWDFAYYIKYLGPDFGVWPLPPYIYPNGTIVWQSYVGNGWSITNPKYSGATPMQIKAALIFVLFFTSYQADLNLAKYALDIPGNIYAFNTFVQWAKEGYFQPSYLNQIVLAETKYIPYAMPVPSTYGLIASVAPYAYIDEYLTGKLNVTQAVYLTEKQMIITAIQDGMLPSNFSLVSTSIIPPILIPPISLISYIPLLSSLLLIPPVVKVEKKVR